MRTYVFIDGSNFYHAMKRYKVVVDYNQLVLWLTAQVAPEAVYTSAFYYTGIYGPSLTPDGEKTPTEHFLRNLEMQTHFHVLREPTGDRAVQCQACGNETVIQIEKCVDTRMTADIVRYAATDAYDAGIIVSNDVDYVPAIEAAMALGKQVYVALDLTTGHKAELRDKASGTILLENGLKRFTFHKEIV